MSRKSVRHVMGNIRTVVHHIGVFERSFPKVLTGSREYTRSHLVVLRDALPDLKRLVRYALDTVPVVARMVGVAGKGASDLTQVTSTLREVRRSTEVAVNEILEVLDRVDPLLEEAAKAEGGNGRAQGLLEEARGQLTLILNSLQFQDITAQRIEATNALLAGLGGGLVALLEGMGQQVGDMPEIEVAEGAFDPTAAFDRVRAGVDQAEVDRWVEGGGGGDVAAAEGPAGGGGLVEGRVSEAEGPVERGFDGERGQAEAAPGGGAEVVSQDDIDALISG